MRRQKTVARQSAMLRFARAPTRRHLASPNCRFGPMLALTPAPLSLIMPKVPSIPDMNFPVLDHLRNMPEIKSPSEYAFDALLGQMKRFQARLSDEKELGIVANGAGLLIHVSAVRVSGQMITFDGVDGNGSESVLIQHFTQVNVQMVAVPKLQDEPRRVGF